MHREHLPGLDVGGTWTNPVRAEIAAREFAYILEVPVEEVEELFGSRVPVRNAGTSCANWRGMAAWKNPRSLRFSRV